MIKKFLKPLYHYYLISKSGLFDRKYYLENYPDVRKADMDPLWHFVRWGWKEERNPAHQFNIEFYNKNNADVKKYNLNPVIHYIKHGIKEGRKATDKQKNWEKENYIQNIEQYTGNPLAYEILMNERLENNSSFNLAYSKPTKPKFLISISEFAEILKKDLETELFVLSLSHDDYINRLGGVQITISDEQLSINRNNIGYLHIFPYENKPKLLDMNSSFYVGVNINGNFVGFINGDYLIQTLASFNNSSLHKIIIHHFMGFDIKFIQNLLNISENNKIFWIHDFFTICPNYFLLRNNIEHCGAPNINSNSCMICLFYEERKKSLKIFQKLFSEENFNVISPSEFALNFWIEKGNLQYNNVKVLPHVELKSYNDLIKSEFNSPLKIAFVGSPIFHKGWFIFQELVREFKDSKHYEFFLFASEGEFNDIELVEVIVNKNDRLAMAKKLKEYEIDVAILWSICPETFSYTLFEAISSGCFVITNPYSGNIQNYIDKHPNRGIILNNYDELIEIFRSNMIVDKVKNYQKFGRQYSLIEFTNKLGSKYDCIY